MSTELRRLRNYIDGEFRDAADGRTTEVVESRDRRGVRDRAAVRSGRRGRRHGSRRRGLPGLARPDPRRGARRPS